MTKPIFKLELETDSLNKAKKLIEQMPVKFDEAMELGMDRVCDRMRTTLAARKIIWSSALFNSIETVKMGEMAYGIKMEQYGYWLNDPKGHWLSMKPGRKITTWAAAHGFINQKTGEPIKPGSTNAGSLYVMGSKNSARYKGWLDYSLDDAPNLIAQAIDEKMEELR